jgi:hypothetical protein
MKLDPLFVYGNYAEAALWAGVAAIAVARRNSGWSIALAAALLAFGVSDLVETRTGGWYKPWWMLAWKSVCVIAIVACGILTRRNARRRGGVVTQPVHEQREAAR